MEVMKAAFAAGPAEGKCAIACQNQAGFHRAHAAAAHEAAAWVR